ncbi:unnamed protein product [Didymodactylos carnosus]|uniref:Fe2OG dioxygenase domain-containing protein n=1 Tax=Didymodactylos carnosus TaxID=1234261 RepID=A0A814A4J9_9BILA|nr:unnamed protein product [Didymodactylos carnosus]CAF1199700.1 unnamed protein product [Didymodactylos carnosus]CAF3688410.1 unnamed protein product [Didymodactylos carnosus]CAF4009850.1 unnamed protein product [Didymodactylos carnosus]
MDSVPIIDVTSLVCNEKDLVQQEETAKQIHNACQEWGFFYIKSHGISQQLQEKLQKQSKIFFAQPVDEKMKISMTNGGRAWRGYFPVGDELTSGKPDQKEGIYLGTELSSAHPKVESGIPLHGKNLFPENMPEFKNTILQYINEMEKLAHSLMMGVSLSLGLEADFFEKNYLKEPTCLFRIFNYPANKNTNRSEETWGVGEHTDYGLLTILLQDNTGGLEVKSKSYGWVKAPPIPDTFVCNIGDMLDRMTGGFYRSTPHRVKNITNSDRLSFPFFFDPSWDSNIKVLPLPSSEPDTNERWDRLNVYKFNGTYGDYIMKKVSKVFPDLAVKQAVVVQ